ncbi:MAG: hypothetical protein KME43_19270 [Myxacorys chilensis ATA2-1-KO14]|jgi:hypothetical protein|nr:hypothetical protein [Myxacorys chilensis ATA2-1-KO14]
MSKKSNINPKTFAREVMDFQDRIFYSNRGKCLQKAAEVLGKTLSPRQAAITHALMVVSDNNLIEYGMGFIDIPVELLFTMITPFNIDLYKKEEGKCVKYMADITTGPLQDLIEDDLILVKPHYQGQCRKFALNKQFVRNYYMAQSEVLNLVIDNMESLGEDVLSYALAKAPRGAGFEYIDRLHPWTVATSDKLQNSRFVFDAAFYHSPEGKHFIKEKNLTSGQAENINCTLEFINRFHTGPQYHESFHLQQAGRMHTVGGVIQMPKWFRDRFILPVDPNNVRVEMDLKCAQLIALCDILEVPQLKETILNILTDKGSIWGSIGDAEMHKAIKKVISYAFCFGGQISNLPFLASKEAKAKRLPNWNVTAKDVNSCLSGLLEPLVEAREEWLQQYTVAKIIKGRGARKIDNDLGYSFSLYKSAAEMGKGKLTKKTLESTKIGSQLLAHLAQGREQFIMQDLIANHVEQNILSFQYDGMTLEMALNEVNDVVAMLQKASLYPIEAEVVLEL